MTDPHNPARYGETWDQQRIDAYLSDLEFLKPFVTFSGGFAWHFLSPVGHTEYKHAHDHKDADLFVPKDMVGAIMALLKGMGYGKVPTKYDRLPSAEEFRRYERVVEDKFRLTIDFFVGDHPTLKVRGWEIIRPDVLLTFYGNVHSSDNCWAVTAASRLLANGEDVENLVGRGELGACPDLDIYFCIKCGWNAQFDWEGKPLPQGNSTGILCRGCGTYFSHLLGRPSYRPLSDAVGILSQG